MTSINNRLTTLRSNHLERFTSNFSSAQDVEVTLDNEKILLFASNNYLGLANSDLLKSTFKQGIDLYGVGSGGSRLTTGSTDIFTEVENKLASLKHQEAALFYATGYMANVGVLSSLPDENWTIFSDSLNHASIIDGCRLSKARTVVYAHTNMSDLEIKLKECSTQYKLIVSDGVFSMHGDIAPLPDLVFLAQKFSAYLMIDDAHATGVLGDRGLGTCEYFNLTAGVDIVVGTASKALGCEGGFVCAHSDIITLLKNTSRSFIFSTAISPAMLYTISRAIDTAVALQEDRICLHQHTQYLRNQLRELGYTVLDGQTPIIPIVVKEAAIATALSRSLLNQGFFISAIRPPSVPVDESMLRITLTSKHTKDHIDALIKAMSNSYSEFFKAYKRE